MKENKRNKWEKRGQVTIFVIIAIVIIGGIIVFFAATDYGKRIVDQVTGREIDVNSELRDCIENNENINKNIEKILIQGGSLEPSNYYPYNDTKVDYLCYTNEFLKTCIMQKPLLMKSIEEEISQVVRADVESCFVSVKEELEARGYNVINNRGEISVEIVPGSLIYRVKKDFSVSRENTQRFENFEIRRNTELYQILSISTSILNSEARIGDSDPVVYMTLYPKIKVEKYKKGEGSKLYILTDRNSGDQFRFAVRSLAWPPGYTL